MIRVVLNWHSGDDSIEELPLSADPFDERLGVIGDHVQSVFMIPCYHIS